MAKFGCPSLERPVTNVIETSIDMSSAAFIFMNFQLSRLELLSDDLGRGILIAAEDLRRALDTRRVRPEVVHVVSLHQPIEFPREMTPREGELVIAKHGLSAFYQTGLARHLLGKRIGRVFICGISSLGEAGATALGAQDIFGHARVVEDAYVETDNECFASTIDLLAALDMLTDINTIEKLRDERFESPVPGEEANADRDAIPSCDIDRVEQSESKIPHDRPRNGLRMR